MSGDECRSGAQPVEVANETATPTHPRPPRDPGPPPPPPPLRHGGTGDSLRTQDGRLWLAAEREPGGVSDDQGRSVGEDGHSLVGGEDRPRDPRLSTLRGSPLHAVQSLPQGRWGCSWSVRVD